MADLTFGPLTVTVYGTDPFPQTVDIYDSGQTGDVVTEAHIEIATTVTGYSGSANAVNVAWYSATDALLSTWNSGLLGWGQVPALEFDPTAPILCTRARVFWGAALNPPGTAYGSVGASANVAGYVRTAGTATHCEYGTYKKPGTDNAIYLTQSALTAFAQRVNALWALPLIQMFAGMLLNGDVLCSGPPPTLPVLTRDDFMFGNPSLPGPGAYAKAWTWLQASAWHELCACVPAPPGLDAPTDFDVPSQPDPPDGVPNKLAPVVCDALDVCGNFNELMAAITALSRQVQFLRSDVTLIQRQEVPFAYLYGASHIGLTGTGEFAVQGILGLSVVLLDIPTYVSRDVDVPVGYYNLGEIALGTDDGWLQTTRVRHNPSLVLDVNASVTRVAYAFPAPIQASITELIREP